MACGASDRALSGGTYPNWKDRRLTKSPRELVVPLIVIQLGCVLMSSACRPSNLMQGRTLDTFIYFIKANKYLMQEHTYNTFIYYEQYHYKTGKDDKYWTSFTVLNDTFMFIYTCMLMNC